jgi:hypothetical protein
MLNKISQTDGLLLVVKTRAIRQNYVNKVSQAKAGQVTGINTSLGQLDSMKLFSGKFQPIFHIHLGIRRRISRDRG